MDHMVAVQRELPVAISMPPAWRARRAVPAARPAAQACAGSPVGRCTHVHAVACMRMHTLAAAIAASTAAASSGGAGSEPTELGVATPPPPPPPPCGGVTIAPKAW
eukprot:scaffold100844_cov63-Phaeocystis_antarctica.AAC.1